MKYLASLASLASLALILATLGILALACILIFEVRSTTEKESTALFWLFATNCIILIPLSIREINRRTK